MSTLGVKLDVSGITPRDITRYVRLVSNNALFRSREPNNLQAFDPWDQFYRPFRIDKGIKGESKVNEIPRHTEGSLDHSRQRDVARVIFELEGENPTYYYEYNIKKDDHMARRVVVAQAVIDFANGVAPILPEDMDLSPSWHERLNDVG